MKRPNDSSDNSDDEQRPSVPAVAELASPPGSSQVLPGFLSYWKFWPLAWNTEMQRENCKINFRYYLFSKNTTSLPVTVLGCWFREASTACR